MVTAITTGVFRASRVLPAKLRRRVSFDVFIAIDRWYLRGIEITLPGVHIFTYASAYLVTTRVAPEGTVTSVQLMTVPPADGSPRLQRSFHLRATAMRSRKTQPASARPVPTHFSAV